MNELMRLAISVAILGSLLVIAALYQRRLYRRTSVAWHIHLMAKSIAKVQRALRKELMPALHSSTKALTAFATAFPASQSGEPPE